MRTVQPLHHMSFSPLLLLHHPSMVQCLLMMSWTMHHSWFWTVRLCHLKIPQMPWLCHTVFHCFCFPFFYLSQIHYHSNHIVCVECNGYYFCWSIKCSGSIIIIFCNCIHSKCVCMVACFYWINCNRITIMTLVT